MSDISDVTEESYPDGLESLAGQDLDNYNRLMEATTKKLRIADQDETTSIATSKPERSDEFLRNFFIKFGMRRTLEQFQQEWFEQKAKG